MTMEHPMIPPLHPGEILREEFMIPLGLTSEALADTIGADPAEIKAISNEERGIRADIAQRLAAHFHTTVAFWQALQRAYDFECRTGDARN